VQCTSMAHHGLTAQGSHLPCVKLVSLICPTLAGIRSLCPAGVNCVAGMVLCRKHVKERCEHRPPGRAQPNDAVSGQAFQNSQCILRISIW